MKEEIKKWLQKAKEDRGEKIIEELREFKESIKKKYGVENMILFGSAVRTSLKNSATWI